MSERGGRTDLRLGLVSFGPGRRHRAASRTLTGETPRDGVTAEEEALLWGKTAPGATDLTTGKSGEEDAVVRSKATEF